MANEHATARYRKIYTKLLRLYPKPFRERFREGMEQTFNDLCQERKEAGKGLFDLSMLTLLVVMILFMFAPVFYGFKVWVKAFGAEEIPLE